MWVKYANEEKYIVQILYKKVQLCVGFFPPPSLSVSLPKIILGVSTQSNLMGFLDSQGLMKIERN